ncbi:MAG: glycosyltransferase [Nocardioides sp.]
MSWDVVVAVPARDEEQHVGAAVRALRAAVADARRAGLLRRCTVELVAHDCRDATETVARACVAADPGWRVSSDRDATTVGEVRDRALRRGLMRLGGRPDQTWLLSTDADTEVGPDWVARILVEAAAHEVQAVVGLADLDRWHGRSETRAGYDDLVAAGWVSRGPTHEHDHVYGANLAVRADAYLASGGFPHVGTGEDQGLVDALAASGVPVLRTRTVTVVTSGRLRGRAERGLAGLLTRLDGAV